MTSLYSFLKMKEFSHYKTGIERIAIDFIGSGYEKFLFTSYRDDVYWTRKTAEKVKGLHDHRAHPAITQFLEQFDRFTANDAVYFFPEQYVPTFYIIREVCKQAKYFAMIENIYPDDETINYIAVFDINDTENIILMNHLAYMSVMSDVFGGFKLYNHSLPYYAALCADGLQRYILDRPNEIMNFMNFQARVDTDPFMIYDVRKRIEDIVAKYYEDEFAFYLDLNYTLLPRLQSFYTKCVEIENSAPPYDWKLKKEQLREELVSRGIINVKWKNEHSLYLLVKKHYPEARYQYRPDWLSPQSIDIYIPNLNIAIEYQGIQHYEAVGYFGGKAAYKHRLQLDERKRRLCRENGVGLIEWEYTYDISPDNLRKILQTVDTVPAGGQNDAEDKRKREQDAAWT